MDARSKKRPGAYVTEGMLSHLRQRIRGSKIIYESIALAIAITQKPVRSVVRVRVRVKV